MAQVLDVHTPQLFENGAGIFDPETGIVPDVADTSPPVDFVDLSRQIKAHDLFEAGMYFETGKERSISLSGTPITAMSVDERAGFTAELQPTFQHVTANWTFSSTAIDITCDGVTKQTSCAFVLNSLGIDPKDAAAIGDSDGDLPILEYVGHAFAPANATPNVRAVATLIASDHTARGTAQILETILNTLQDSKHAHKS